VLEPAPLSRVSAALPAVLEPADLERRFGGLRRLHGDAAYARLRAARVAVVGLGGVGSWAVEALARSGVAELVLIDLDHVGESNINRQVQATSATLGQSKAQALSERIALIHPGCVVRCVEEFADAQNWPALLGGEVDAVIDACDQSHAKLAMAGWALQSGARLVIVGAAGGKHLAQAVEVAPLLEVTHDPLLASLRQRLRRAVPAPWPKGALRCVFSREAVAPAAPSGEAGDVAGDVAGDGAGDVAGGAAAAADAGEAKPIGDRTQSDNGLNCHGYGSSVAVTATFGMAAAGEAIAQIAYRDRL
jgi:tRNA threonylcarbamoyladenosine dehydratase